MDGKGQESGSGGSFKYEKDITFSSQVAQATLAILIVGLILWILFFLVYMFGHKKRSLPLGRNLGLVIGLSAALLVAIAVIVFAAGVDNYLKSKYGQ